MATSTFFIFLDTGLGFGPYLRGFIIPVTGYSILYSLMALFILLTAGLYYILHGKKESSEKARFDASAAG
ncbi:hypothetical protein NCCP133_22040 [Cytobacillus sp. NCCP-133]|nr:hypothetical protein NCCP133_22040 [Cytobacillus sp. NCCP-133]